MRRLRMRSFLVMCVSWLGGSCLPVQAESGVPALPPASPPACTPYKPYGQLAPDYGSGACTGNHETAIAIPHIGNLIHHSLRSALNRGFGLGFDFEMERRIEVITPGIKVDLVLGDGTTIPLVRLSDGSYVAKDVRLNQSKFVFTSSGATETTLEQSILTYQAMTGRGHQLVSIKDRHGNVTLYTRDGVTGIATKIEDPFHRSINFNLDKVNRRVASIVDPAGNTYTLEYDSTGRLGRVSLPNATQWVISYDGFDRIIKTVAPDGTTESMGYTISGMLAYIVDTNNYLTGFTYYPTGVRVMDGFHSFSEVFELGRLKATVHDGLNTSLVRDSVGRLVRVTDPSGTETSFTYVNPASSPGNPASASYFNIDRTTVKNGPLSTSTSYTYHTNQIDLATVTDAAGTTTYQYNKFHQPTSVSTNGKTTAYQYSTMGDLTQETSPSGLVVGSATYFPNGHLESTTDRYHNQTKYAYNAFGQVASVTDPLGRVTVYKYDNLGRPREITTPTSVVTSRYDLWGRREGVQTTKSGNRTLTTTVSSSFSDGHLLSMSTNSTSSISSTVYQISQTFDPSQGDAYATGLTVNGITLKGGENFTPIKQPTSIPPLP